MHPPDSQLTLVHNTRLERIFELSQDASSQTREGQMFQVKCGCALRNARNSDSGARRAVRSCDVPTGFAPSLVG